MCRCKYPTAEERSGGEARNLDGRGSDETRQAATIGVSRDASLVRVAAGELEGKNLLQVRNGKGGAESEMTADHLVPSKAVSPCLFRGRLQLCERRGCGRSRLGATLLTERAGEWKREMEGEWG